MNRCLTAVATALRLICLPGVVAIVTATTTPSALAQMGVRPFPAQALRGTLEVTIPPQVLLNGLPDQLSPGARIRDTQNMLALSATLVGQALTVNYVRDQAGLIHEVWILTPAEARERRASSASE